jgi:hypothetical protein
MNKDSSKIAAAIAAVGYYLQAEAEMKELAAQPHIAAAEAAAGVKLWALNGRQTQMQLRNLMQLRTFSRI